MVSTLESTLQSEEKVNPGISTDRYHFKRKVGNGAWGAVYLVDDTYTKQKDLAIKVLDPTQLAREQMVHRNLDQAKAVINESRDFAACSNVVPGKIDFDKEGIPFVVMPYYESFLSDVLESEGKRNSLNNGISPERANKYLLGIARGLSEVHNQLKRVHSDLKPDNIALDNLDGRPLINDFGTSTCASMTGATVSSRDNMGFAYSRAPECFSQDSHPSKESDVFSFFSIGYRILNPDGEYPFEKELSENPDYYKTLTPSEFGKVLKGKLRKIPRVYRPLLEKCGKFASFERLNDGREVLSELEKVIEKQNGWKVLKSSLRKAITPVAIGALLSAALYAGAIRAPKEDSMPKLEIHETPYENVSNDKIVFIREDPNLLQLPKPRGGDMFTDAFYTRIGRYASDNKTVCNLLKAYNDAIFTGGLLHTPQRNGYYNEEQMKMWNAARDHSGGLPQTYQGELHHQIVAKSIEYALTQSKIEDNKVDLEDTLAIALLGKERVDQAKRAVSSTQFARYLAAKDSKGQYIIEKNNQTFLKEWLSQVYYNDDPRAFEKY